jgi:hypothetical protein
VGHPDERYEGTARCVQRVAQRECDVSLAGRLGRSWLLQHGRGNDAFDLTRRLLLAVDK